MVFINLAKTGIIPYFADNQILSVDSILFLSGLIMIHGADSFVCGIHLFCFKSTIPESGKIAEVLQLNSWWRTSPLKLSQSCCQNVSKMSAKCQQNVSKMSAKCQRSLKNCIVLQHFDQHACQTRVGWRTTDRPTFHKGKKSFWLWANFHQIFWKFSLIPLQKCKLIFLLVFWTYLVNRLFKLILLVVLTSWMKCCQSLAECLFVMTLPMSKQQYLLPVACHFYCLSATCRQIVGYLLYIECCMLCWLITPCCKIQL